MDTITASLMAAIAALAGAVCFMFRQYEKAQGRWHEEQAARIADHEKYNRVHEEILKILRKGSAGGD